MCDHRPLTTADPRASSSSTTRSDFFSAKQTATYDREFPRFSLFHCRLPRYVYRRFPDWFPRFFRRDGIKRSTRASTPLHKLPYARPVTHTNRSHTRTWINPSSTKFTSPNIAGFFFLFLFDIHRLYIYIYTCTRMYTYVWVFFFLLF